MSIKIENFGEYSVKNIKSFMGMDTMGFNAVLYRGKKRIAECVDDGRGGDVMIRFLGEDRNTESDMLKQHCDSLPQLDTDYDFKLPIDNGLFVSELISKFEEERDIRKMQKLCTTKTLYKTSQQRGNQYYILNSICDERVRQHLRTKHGNDVEIFNDVFSSGGIPSVLSPLT